MYVILFSSVICHGSKLIETVKTIIMNKLNEEILSLKEAAEFLKITTSCMYKKTSSKQIPHYIPGGKKIYFKKSELENWILSHKVDSINELDSEINDYLNRTAKIQISC